MCLTFGQLDQVVFGQQAARDGEVSHGGSELPCLRQEDGEERQDERGQDAVEVHLLRRELGAQDRQRGQAARGLPVLAAGARAADRHAWRRQDVPEEDGALLGDMADAAQGRGAAQGRLRRRHTPRQEGRRAHRLRRRARPRLAPVPLREQPRLGGAGVARRGARARGLGRRERLRQGPEGDVARDEAPGVRVPCLPPGQALHHLTPAHPGRRRALRAGEGLALDNDAREADGWVQALLAWSGRWDALLSETSVGEDGRLRLVHERLVKARRSLVRLVDAGTLFTYLDPGLVREGPLPSCV